MESRRFKIGRRETEQIIAEKARTCFDIAGEYIDSFFDKLKQHRIKIETVLYYCEVKDRNSDGVIHADDFIDVVDDLLPRKTITRREYHYLIDAMGGGKGTQHNVKYMKLENLYEKNLKDNEQTAEIENWFDEAYDEEFSGPRGSIGDFLNKSACPSEIENYKTLIACLEKFERETGMRISTHEDGFRIPLGPDLTANLAFNTNSG